MFLLNEGGTFTSSDVLVHPILNVKWFDRDLYKEVKGLWNSHLSILSFFGDNPFEKL